MDADSACDYLSTVEQHFPGKSSRDALRNITGDRRLHAQQRFPPKSAPTRRLPTQVSSKRVHVSQGMWAISSLTQVYFFDCTEVILWAESRWVTYRDKQGVRHTHDLARACKSHPAPQYLPDNAACNDGSCCDSSCPLSLLTCAEPRSAAVSKKPDLAKRIKYVKDILAQLTARHVSPPVPAH